MSIWKRSKQSWRSSLGQLHNTCICKALALHLQNNCICKTVHYFSVKARSFDAETDFCCSSHLWHSSVSDARAQLQRSALDRIKTCGGWTIILRRSDILTPPKFTFSKL